MTRPGPGDGHGVSTDDGAAQARSLFPSVLESSSDPDVQAAFAKSHDMFGSVSDLFNKLANAPTLLSGWIDMLRPIRTTLVVSPQLFELLTIRVAQVNGTTLLAESHSRLARKAGVSPEKVAAVTHWREADLFSADECNALHLAEQLTIESRVDDEVIMALQASIGIRATLELVVVAAFYNCTTRVANVVRSDPNQFEALRRQAEEQP